VFESSMPVRAFQQTTSARPISLLLVLAVTLGLPAIAFGAAEPGPASAVQVVAEAGAPQAPAHGPFGPELVGQLVLMNDRLDLDTSPDDSPFWPGRLAAAIELRTGGRYATSATAEAVPGHEILRRLAVELRGLRAEQGEPPGGSNRGAEPPGRERAERLRRILETVRLLNRKLDRLEGTRGRQSSIRAQVAPGNDACASATVISDGTVSGSTTGATADGSSSCGTSDASPDVWFRYTASAAGLVTFDTHGSAYDTVLSLHGDCPGGAGDVELACSDDTGGTVQSEITRDMAAGEEVWIRLSGFAGSTGNFDLTVEPTRGISGTVTQQETGSPVSGANVTIYDQYGYYVAGIGTGADGTYMVGGLAAGDYYVQAGADGLITELYDGVVCSSFSSCYPAYDGTPVTVGTGFTTGIDFALGVSGALSGTVTATATGDPLSVYLRLYSVTGDFLDSLYSGGGSGFYEISGLPTGKYFVVASEYDYLREVYDDIPCPDWCDPTTGTEIAVTNGATVTGIDFSLEHLGTVTGTLIDAITGDPVSGQGVAAYASDGSSGGRVYTATDGTYQTRGLLSGTYFVRTETGSHQDEVYDDIVCEPSCDTSIGSPVVVALDTTVTGIDFSLVPFGKISGTVLETGTGDPVDGQRVKLYGLAGSFSNETYTAADGSYTFDSLPTGTYAVWTYTTTHQNELWDDILCEPDCDVTTGDPISVSLASTTTGVDFSLVRRGKITGKITSRVGSVVPGWIHISFYSNGYYFGYADLASDGTYESPPLRSGDYFVLANANYGPYVSQLYDGIACMPSCTVTTGMPVTVALETTTSGVNFTLDRYGAIEGTVTAADTGYGLPAYVAVLDGTGSQVGLDYVGAGGAYSVDRLPPGTYYVKAGLKEYDGSVGDLYQDELFDDVPCEPTCDLGLGTALPVVLNGTIFGVDFVLTACPGDTTIDLVGTLFLSTHVKQACEQLTAGTNTTVATGADVTFEAGRRIVLTDGFVIESGASFRAVIEPAWSPD